MSDSLEKIIANNIFSLRNKHKLTQKEFAAKLNLDISREQISRIETRLNIPNSRFIKAVSDTFGVSTDWILSAQNTNLPKFNIKNSELKLIFQLRKIPLESKEIVSTLVNILYNMNNK